jgi:hypothetical protein
MQFIEVLDPTSRPRVAEHSLAPRRGSLAGKTIGFLSNRKANADLLLDCLEKEFRGRLGDFSVVKTGKGAASAAPEDVMARLRGCDAVVTALAD